MSVPFPYWYSRAESTIRFGWECLINRLRLLKLGFEVEPIHGYPAAAIAPRSAIVLCVIKDSEHLVEAFIEHYLELGVKHLFFLDNGSTDETITLIKACPNTTVVRSLKPFRSYYVAFKNYLIQQFGAGQWCVVADVDEFLQLPLQRTLQQTLSYLNANHYDAVCIQMLDMFSEAGLVLKDDHKRWTLEPLKTVFCYYDLSGVTQRPYVRSFQPDIPAGLSFLSGGIRKTWFDRDCFLTKEALFYAYGSDRAGLLRWLPRLRYLESSHLLFSLPFCRIKLADFSALFLHYKFTNDFYAATQTAVAAENHWNNSQEYKAYQQVISEKAASQETFDLRQPTSHRLAEVDQLIEQDFLFVSQAFRQQGAWPR